MRRRTFLATTGALLSAGCSEIVPPPGTTEASETTGSPSEAATGTPSDGVPTAGTTTDPGPDPTTDQPTETTTETPSEAERAVAEALSTARSLLSDSLAAYRAFADTDEPTLLDVTAATQVSVSDVTSLASDAREVLEEAPRYVDEDVQHLQGVADFLTTGIRCQSSLNSAYSRFEFVRGRVYAEDFASLTRQLDDLRDRRDNAGDFLETLQSETGRSDMQAFEPLSADDYDAKITQLQREVSAFGTLADALETMGSGLETFIDGNDEFTDDDYDDANELYATANQAFRTANEALTTLDTPNSLTDAVSELRSVTDALAAGTQDLVEAAAAGDEYEWETYDAEFADAVSELRASQVAVDEIDSVADIIGYYERGY